MTSIRFATNRMPLAPGGFGTGCEAPGTPPHLGRAEVQPGGLPELDGTLLREPPAEDPLPDAAARIAWLADWLVAAQAEGAVPLLSVHGFCYTLADAVKRAAQLAAFYAGGPFRLRLAPLAFCWPSFGRLDNDDYLLDRGQCQRSDTALAMLIQEIAAATAMAGVRPVLLAHSMGVFMTRLGVAALAARGLPGRPPFAQAVLMAGDDERTALDPGGPLRPIAELADHVTVGVFRGDSVIQLNERVLGRADRIGLHGPAQPGALPPNVAVVDYGFVVDQDLQPPQSFRDVGPNLIGHQYYRLQPRVRDDLAQVFAGAAPAEVRGRRRGEEMINRSVAINPIAGRLYPVGALVA
ncbi:MAG TPA: alpha/beta hydrolase [Crenalkalicoccus sp.]|nr:alpha/beta hydrolase [Crenalkalicoccus sp.]